MDTSIFGDKKKVPTDQDLKNAIGPLYKFWSELRIEVKELFPQVSEEWNFPGEKYGWSFRMKDKKRAIIYLLPRDGFFKVAFVFGQKATDIIMNSAIRDDIKNELAAAKPYAEGRGIRIDVHDGNIIKDLKELIRIKLAN